EENDDAEDRRGTRHANDSARVTLDEAQITKSVAPGAAPVGATVEYTVEVRLPGNANFYNVTLSDSLPQGVEYVEGSSRATFDWAGAPSEPDSASVEPKDSELEWTILDEGDEPVATIETHSEPRTITITYEAKISDAV